MLKRVRTYACNKLTHIIAQAKLCLVFVHLFDNLRYSKCHYGIYATACHAHLHEQYLILPYHSMDDQRLEAQMLTRGSIPYGMYQYGIGPIRQFLGEYQRIDSGN